MPGRGVTSSVGYRYGFNGKEKDFEIKGDGNSYDFGARIYDPRLGRWLAVDPLASRHFDVSPYNYVLNNPIYLVDKNGETEDVYITVIDRSGKKMTIHMPQTDDVLKIPYTTSIRMGPDGDFLTYHGTKEYNTVYTATYSYEGVEEGGAPKLIKSALYTSEVGKEKGWTWYGGNGGTIESDLGDGEPREWADLVGLVGGGKMGAKSIGQMSTSFAKNAKNLFSIIANALKAYKSFDKIAQKLDGKKPVDTTVGKNDTTQCDTDGGCGKLHTKDEVDVEPPKGKKVTDYPKKK